MAKTQYAMVMDLNKCLGCQTCTVACKKLWTDLDGMDYMYWNNVETRPGKGYPAGGTPAGGGFAGGQPIPGEIPPLEKYGGPFEYDYSQRPFEGEGKPGMPHADPSF